MKPQKPRNVKKALEKLGFSLVRQKGSHLQYEHQDGRIVTVLQHGTELLREPMMNNIIRGIGDKDKSKFEELLGIKH